MSESARLESSRLAEGETDCATRQGIRGGWNRIVQGTGDEKGGRRRAKWAPSLIKPVLFKREVGEQVGRPAAARRACPKSGDGGWRACSWRRCGASPEGVTGHLPLERVAAHESSGEGKAFPLTDEVVLSIKEE